MTGSLRVLEADLSDFHLDNPSSRVWPDFAPKVDGVIVCYDSSSLASFTHVERLVCTHQLPCSQETVTKVIRWLQRPGITDCGYGLQVRCR